MILFAEAELGKLSVLVERTNILTAAVNFLLPHFEEGSFGGDLSQFAADYKKVFHESPSETLRRR